MAVPVVAIVGRPNVGKSSLFNWLAGRRIAIVDPTAGVTRDRVSTLVEADGRYFELIDTGGIGIEDVDNLTAEVERQITVAIDQAHVILFVVDVRAGLMPLDEEVGRRLRYVTKPVILVANKCDDAAMDPQATEFYKLGRGKALAASRRAEPRPGRAAPASSSTTCRRPDEAERPQDVSLKLAIVGRRNTGKSTFINSLAKAERMIVSEVPGTTRDSVDVRFERDGKTFIAIDTAGVRKKKSISSNIEFYSWPGPSGRSAGPTWCCCSSTRGCASAGGQAAGRVRPRAAQAGDLRRQQVGPDEGEHADGEVRDYLRAVFPRLDYVPIAFITAKNGKNVYTLLNLAQNLHKQASARVGTGDLNRVVREALDAQPPPHAAEPPAQGLLRHPGRHQSADHRAVHQRAGAVRQHLPALPDQDFRDQLPFAEVPIKLYLRAKKRDEAAAGRRHGAGNGDGDPEEGQAVETGHARPVEAAVQERGHRRGIGARGQAADRSRNCGGICDAMHASAVASLNCPPCRRSRQIARPARHRRGGPRHRPPRGRAAGPAAGRVRDGRPRRRRRADHPDILRHARQRAVRRADLLGDGLRPRPAADRLRPAPGPLARPGRSAVVRPLLIPGAVLVRFVVNISVISQASTAVAVGTVLVPLLRSARLTFVDDRRGPGLGLFARRRAVKPRSAGGQHDRHTFRGGAGRLRPAGRAGPVPATGRGRRGLLADVPVGGSEGRGRQRADAGGEGRRFGTVSRQPVQGIVPIVPILAAHGRRPAVQPHRRATVWLVDDNASPATISGPGWSVSSMLIGTALASLTTPRSAGRAANSFFEGAGLALTRIISIIVVATCFGEGIKLLQPGRRRFAGRSQGREDLVWPIAGSLTFLFALLCGSGMAATQSLYRIFVNDAMSTEMMLRVGGVVAVSAAAGRTMSPVAAVNLVSADLTDTEAIAIARRVAVPMLIATAVTISVAWWRGG